MLEPTEPNPYSPTTSESVRLVEPRPANSVSTVLVGLNVYGGIVLSGAVFGVGLFSVLRGFPPNGEVFLILAVLFLAGALWAGAMGLPLVVATLTVLQLATRVTRYWTPRSLRLVAGPLGAIAGLMCWAVPALLADGGLVVLVALVPATVGGVGCSLMIEPLVRQARRHAASQPADHSREIASRNPFLLTDTLAGQGDSSAE